MVILRQFKVMRLEIHKKKTKNCFCVEYVCLYETERQKGSILASLPPSKTNQNNLECCPFGISSADFFPMGII